MKTAAAFLLGALSAASVARAPSKYVDSTYGFSIDAPAFPAVPKDGACTPAMFLAPPEGGFATNVNVLIQENGQTLAEFAARSRNDVKALDLKPLQEKEIKVSGRPALLLEYAGPMQGRALHWLAVAVAARNRIYQVTATCAEADWARHEKALRASLESFALTE